MADNSTIGTMSDFSVLAERLYARNNQKETEKLNRNIEGLNKSILAFAKTLLPTSDLGNKISDISQSRRTFNTAEEIVRGRLFGRTRSLRNKFSSTRNILDTMGVVTRGSGSVFDQLLERRDVKNQFIRDQLFVNPQMTDTKQNREAFGKKFETQQKLQKQLNTIQGEINRLEEGGFTEKQIQRSGIIKKRDEVASKLIASDNRLYGTVRDEMVESIKEGIKEGIEEAAKEAEKIYKTEGEQGIKDYIKGSGGSAGTIENQEAMNEEQQIQEGILRAQEELVKNTQAIVDALENDEEDFKIEKRESVVGGWIKTLLGAVGGLLTAKITGVIGLFTSTFSKLLSPITKFLGIGAAKAASGAAGNIAAGAAGAAALSKGTSILDKVKGMTKFALPKLATAGRVAATLLLSKPAIIAATAATAAGVGYSMLPEKTRENIEEKVSRFLGKTEQKEEEKISKQVRNDVPRIGKSDMVRVGDIVLRKSQELATGEIKKAVSDSNTTIINSPTTNNSNSVINNHIKPQPRNYESSYTRFILNRYAI